MPIITASGFERPSFDELLTARLAAYRGQFGEFAEDGVLSRLAESDAEMMHALYSYIEKEAQSFQPRNAVGTRLLDWGLDLIGPMKSATASGGSARFLGADGVEVPAGRRMIDPAGTEFEVVTGGVAAGGAVDLTVTAIASGKTGNAATGVVLTLLNPVLGLDAAGLVQAPGLTGGVEAETEDEYRARILARLSDEKTGGNDADYKMWALQAPGVTRAWVQRGPDGSGEVVVLFSMDGTYPDGIPVGSVAPAYSGDLLTLYTHLLTMAPAPAVLYVSAPAPRVINYVIHGLSPDSPEIRAAIAAELQDLHARKSDVGRVWRWSWAAEAISIAAGEDGFDSIEPNTSTVCAETELAVFGGVTYV